MLNLDDIPFWLGLGAVVLSLIWWFSGKRYKLPPGPRGLPLVGYIPYLGNSPPDKIISLSKKYGPILSLNLGGQKWIFLNDFPSVKEVFNNPAALNRPEHYFDCLIPDGVGVLSLNGEEWIEQRRYCRKTLKDIGLGTTPWENILQEEVDEFMKYLESQNGEAVNIVEALTTAISNNVLSIVLGKRLLAQDSRRKLVHEAVKSFLKVLSPNNKGSLCPRLFKFLNKFGVTSYTDAFNTLDEFNSFLWKEVRERKSVPVAERNDDIFIDGYLSEISKEEQKGIPSSFNDKNLVANSQALVFAATESNAISLIWLLLAMCSHQDTQKKVQDEIDEVLGRDGKLKWMERIKVPYTYATIMEGQRWRTVGPFGVFHRTNQNITVRGYDIPTGVNIAANLYALHNDESYWKNHKDFEPRRFLNEDGTLIVNRLESYVPFSVGRRSCPGEMIAMMELFHFFISILQKFHVRTEEGKTAVLEGILESTYQPVPQKLRFIPRE